MTCAACNAASTHRHSGRYALGCLDCCARLVLSTHPGKAQAAAMLAVIERHRDAPSRKDVLSRVREMLEARHDAPKVPTRA